MGKLFHALTFENEREKTFLVDYKGNRIGLYEKGHLTVSRSKEHFYSFRPEHQVLIITEEEQSKPIGVIHFKGNITCIGFNDKGIIFDGDFDAVIVREEDLPALLIPGAKDPLQ